MSATRAYELCCMQLSIAGAYFRLGMRELLPRPPEQTPIRSMRRFDGCPQQRASKLPYR